MSEIPITTEQIQMLLWISVYGITAYLINTFVNLYIGRKKEFEEEDKKEIDLISKIKNWWKKRKKEEYY